jgi:hypothetical protein
VRAHISGGHPCCWIVALFNETDLFWLTVALHWDVINNVNSAIDKLLLWKECLENEFSVSHIQTVQVFCLDFILGSD